jgi:DNA-binding CsgD family transcriptional regulator
MITAYAHRARGRLAATRGEAADEFLGRAVELFAKLAMPLEAARARVALAEGLAPSQPEVALVEARAAFESFEAVGAAREADRAAALVRELGGPARTGPKALGLLTRREREVLALLGEGLSNPEIAARLYVSTRTAEHHVSNILTKLHVRSRTEAASVALRHGGDIRDGR